MKLNLSVQKNDVEYRFTSYGDRQDLMKILEAFQSFGALTVYCSLREEKTAEETPVQ